MRIKMRSGNCDIRTIDNDEDEVADVVFVYEYTDCIVESIDTEAKTVALKQGYLYKNNKHLVLDEKETRAFVEYYDGESPVGSYLQNSLETSSENEITSVEQKYLDELKACIEEDNEIQIVDELLLDNIQESQEELANVEEQVRSK